MCPQFKSNHKKNKKSTTSDITNQFPKKIKKRSEAEKERYIESLSSSLHIPNDILAGAAILTATGRNQICIENYKGIIEYTGELIRIQTKTCRINIEGKRLNIEYFTDDEMKITGMIEVIKYSN